MYICPCCEFLTLSEKKEAALRYAKYVDGRMIMFNTQLPILRVGQIKLV